MKMSLPNKYFCETHMIGSECRQNSLDREHYSVLRNAPFIWVGFSILKAPYRMVRLHSVHSHIVACIDGKGHVLIDGKLVCFEPGQVMLGPVGVHHAFEVTGSGEWTIAWVFYEDLVSSPVLKGTKAQLISAKTELFATTLQMLLQEAAGTSDYAAMTALVTLLDIQTRRMVRMDRTDDRLWRLWMQVEAKLAHDWSASKLAKLACMSQEHLRRLCQKYYQRSPMKHLTHLRLRRASTLLRSTHEKVENIAQSVGYASMFSFSVAFKRWSGIPPSQFRQSDP